MLDLARGPSPRPPFGPALAAPAAAAPAAALGVLVIDDDPVHRMVLCKTAERAGFVPTPAASFGAAVACLRRGSYSAITLDLSLGTRNGLDVMHALVEMGCRTPIVIVSGSNAAMRSETASMAALMRLDVREALPKPVDLTLLRQLLVRIRQTAEAGATAPLPA
ncbi:response regulator [Rhodoplanes sp. TEM]|uniref:Response regulator n=1 Tax=Rhodoplanes tepidamans TaxID=200616 RepID=A0ABT5J7B0_RHOTP|nr:MULTISPECIES: response regulator [Rhodoplanes]MDC7785179.1 response regulator [Rhodoplanes tepidamans]MDC7987129.1 response regulator [Rhodoplanes sp. TEM]MDQ0353436.1 CheY-like chemotaxis protein [Rhodoplanes tepidamans]